MRLHKPLLIALIALVTVVDARAGGGALILNMDSHWRYHLATRSVGVIYRGQDGEKLVIREGGEHIVGEGHRLDVDEEGNLPRRGGWREIRPMTGPWMAPDFDDSGWMVQTGAFYPGRPYPVGHGQGEINRLSRLFVRGKFVVEDPARVTRLELSAQYRGGIVVYLNGREVARGHVGDGTETAATMPEDYPAATVRLNPTASAAAAEEAAGLRLRTLRQIDLPREHLTEGVNVLAIEVLAAAMPYEAVGDRTAPQWATAGLQDVRLVAWGDGARTGHRCEPDRPVVWTTSVLTDLKEIRQPDPADLHGGIPPIRITAARNAVVSGQAVVSAGEPVQGLSARIGPFAAERGTRLRLPPGAVRIRYPARTIEGMDYEMDRPDVLVDEPTGQERVQPVWVTVRVPADAPAGTYRATLTIEADGLSGPAEVPVELVVHDWDMPDPQQWRTMVSLVQSPHSVAWHYGAAMWSDRHLELLKPSLSMMGALGNNVLHVDVVVPSFFSPQHGVIVFREQGDRLVPDFTYFDRFLDAYAEHVGRPRRIALGVWDLHLVRDPELTVTVRNPDGTLENRRVPMYGEPGSARMWQPVLDGVRQRVLRRGWDERAILVGVAGDQRPSGETVAFFGEIAPFARWAIYTHGRGEPNWPDAEGRIMLATGWPGTIHENAMSAGLREYPYNAGWQGGGRAGGLRDGLQRGWVEDWYAPMTLYAGRGILYDQSPLVSFRLFANSQAFNRSQGFTRQGIDKWPVINPHAEAGQPRPMVHGVRGWGNLYRGKVRAMTAPGPDGALPTARFEMLREGLQDTEVRIYLERLLADERTREILGEAFEAEVKALVAAEVIWRDSDTRQPFAWTAGTDWPQRLDRLYALAAQAARTVGSAPFQEGDPQSDR